MRKSVEAWLSTAEKKKRERERAALIKKPAGKAKIGPRDGPNMLMKIKGPQKGFYIMIQRIEISPVCPKLLI